VVDRPDLPFGRAVAAGLGALDDACDVLGDRIRGDEVHFGSEAALASELRLLDRSRRSERRLDRERLPPLDVYRGRSARTPSRRRAARRAEWLSRLLHPSVEGIAAPRTSRRSAIVVVETAEDGNGHDVAAAPRGGRRAERDEMTEPLMRPSAIEIREAVFSRDALQVTLAEHDDVVQALAANAAQKSLAEGIHERRLRGGTARRRTWSMTGRTGQRQLRAAWRDGTREPAVATGPVVGSSGRGAARPLVEAARPNAKREGPTADLNGASLRRRRAHRDGPRVECAEGARLQACTGAVLAAVNAAVALHGRGVDLGCSRRSDRRNPQLAARPTPRSDERGDADSRVPACLQWQAASASWSYSVPILRQ
jgi:hypothetical protein